jgi:purine nucleoside phosphorylase
MRRVALIGGTGSSALVPAHAGVMPLPTTQWGDVSAPVHTWRHGAVDITFLPRHGIAGELVAPHRINYRANIQALCDLQPEAVIAVNSVGGIAAAAWSGRVVLPHQLIDYTSGREQSFFDGTHRPLKHVEFDPPFTESLRGGLAAAAQAAGVDALDAATYGVTQGPRLETAAEIDRLAADGCDIVGMTAMPEAALAREAGLAYAMCAVVANRAAGRLPPGGSIQAELPAFMAEGMRRVRHLLETFFAAC